MASKIIFLNGCSSAGKTSVVKAIQYLSEEPWLTFGIDAILEAIPDKYFGFGLNAEQGFQFVSTIDQEGFSVTEVKTGPYGEKVSNSVPKIIKQLVDDGHNLIIDEVIWERKDLEKYLTILKDYKIRFIKIDCQLSLMEEREILRGDRTRGLARAQHEKMKNLVWNYDLEIDTNQVNPFANAKRILKFLKIINGPM